MGMGRVGGDMGKFMQYQTAQAIPKFAEGTGGGVGHAGKLAELKGKGILTDEEFSAKKAELLKKLV